MDPARTPEDPAARTPHHVVVSVLATMAVPALSFFVGLILARGLGPDGRGLVAAAIAPLTVATTFSHAGLIQSTTYFAARTDESWLVWLRSMAFVGVTSLVIMPALWLILDQSPVANMGLLAVLALVAAVPVLSATNIARAASMGARDFPAVNFERVASPAFRLVLIAALFFVGSLKVGSAIGVYAFSLCLGLMIFVPRLFSRNRRVVESKETPVTYRSILSYAARSAGGVVAVRANERLDQVIMAAVGTATELGYYAVAVPIAELPKLLAVAVRIVVLPEATAGNRIELIERYARATMAAVLAVSATLAFVAPWLVPALFGASFEGAIVPTLILIIGSLPLSLSLFLGISLQASGRPGSFSVAQGAGLLVTLPILPFAVRSYGAVGAAATSVATYSLTAAVAAVLLQRGLGRSWVNYVRVGRKDLSLLIGSVARVIKQRGGR